MNKCEHIKALRINTEGLFILIKKIKTSIREANFWKSSESGFSNTYT